MQNGQVEKVVKSRWWPKNDCDGRLMVIKQSGECEAQSLHGEGKKFALNVINVP